MKDLKHIESPRDWELPTRNQLLRWNAELFKSCLIGWALALLFLGLWLFTLISHWP